MKNGMKNFPGWNTVSKDTAHCFCCRHFGGELSSPDRKFISVGWRKGKDKLKKHSRSAIHKDKTISWQQFKRIAQEGATVAVKISDKSRSERQIADNRYYIGCIIEVLLLCAQQDIALRCHDETEESMNPKRIFQFLVSRDPQLQARAQTVPANATYMSPDIQKTLLTVIGDLIREKIRDEVNESGFYALMVDETKDVSKQEQITVVLLYVLKGTVYERFLTFSRANSQLRSPL